jgi:hypothetical protein
LCWLCVKRQISATIPHFAFSPDQKVIEHTAEANVVRYPLLSATEDESTDFALARTSSHQNRKIFWQTWNE